MSEPTGPAPWLYGRQALDTLAAGYRKAYTSTTGEICRLRHESPEPRVVRVAYEGDKWRQLQQFYVLKLVVRQYSDAAQTEQRVLVPWQGVAWQLPAGRCDLILTTDDGFESRPDGQSLDGVVNIELSTGATGRQCRQPEPSVLSSQDDGWFDQTGIDLLPPMFATCATIATFEGSDLNFIAPTNGQSMYVPTPRSFSVPIPLPGWIRVEGGGSYTVLWEVSL